MKTGKEKLGLDVLQQFVEAYPVQAFRPLAYYDKHLDCIRVQVKDCSFTEERVNRFFTFWYENHVESKEVIGFTIKGVKHLFDSLGLPQTGPVIVAHIIDAMLRLYPDQTMQKTIAKIRQKFKDSLQLPVSELPQEPLTNPL